MVTKKIERQEAAKLNTLSKLEALLARTKKLSVDEYTDLLEMLLKNYLALLAIDSVQGVLRKDVYSLVQCVERVHYLLDSLGKWRRVDLDAQEQHVLGWSLDMADQIKQPSA